MKRLMQRLILLTIRRHNFIDTKNRVSYTLGAARKFSPFFHSIVAGHCIRVSTDSPSCCMQVRERSSMKLNLHPVSQSDVGPVRKAARLFKTREAGIALVAALLWGFFEDGLLQTGIGASLKEMLLAFPQSWSALITFTGYYLLAVLFVWASCISKTGVRFLYFIVFSVTVFIEYGYFKVYGRFAELHDIRIAITATPENYRDAVLAYVNWLSLIPVGFYGLFLVMTRHIKKAGIGIAVALCGVIFFGILISVQLVQQKPQALSTVSFFRSAVVVIDWPWILKYSAPRETLTFRAAEPPKNNIVLIIDESFRSDHFTINGYKRNTTPFLTELADAGDLYNWGTASSAATYSDPSNVILLTGVTDLPDTTYRTRLNPSIFQYAKAMGYTTSYYSGQYPRGPVEFSDDDMTAIDHLFTIREMTANDRIDFEIAGRVHPLLNKKVGQFIVIQKLGAHFNYDNQYPAKEALWLPVLKDDRIDPSTRQAMINSYDNALRYNSEGFFRALLGERNFLDHTVIVYTSDHGQTLGEAGATHTHAGRTRHEAMVPLFIITRQKLAADTNYKASHFNIFATLLDLMKIPPPERKHPYAPSLLGTGASESRPRYYLAGALHGATMGRYRDKGAAAFLPFDP